MNPPRRVRRSSQLALSVLVIERRAGGSSEHMVAHSEIGTLLTLTRTRLVLSVAHEKCFRYFNISVLNGDNIFYAKDIKSLSEVGAECTSCPTDHRARHDQKNHHQN